MNLYAFDDYKLALKARLKELRPLRKGLNLSRLATKVGIQYTYLSRVLSQSDKHLAEDALFAICGVLEFFAEETDYLLLLRSRDTTQSKKRRDYLQAKIVRLQRERAVSIDAKSFSTQNLAQEMNYLFDPLAIVIHAALYIDEFREHPRRLANPLGISEERISDCLRLLAHLNFIELDSNTGRIQQRLAGRMHYGVEHPLMRASQQLLKLSSLAQLQKLSESDKQSFNVTFAADEAMLPKLRELFNGFLKEVEQLSRRSVKRRVYQLNFDCFSWI